VNGDFTKAFWDGFCMKVFWDWYDSQPEPKRIIVFMVLTIGMIFGFSLLGALLNDNPVGGAMGGALGLLFLSALRIVRRRG